MLFTSHSTWSNSKRKPVSFREADDRQCIASLKDKDSKTCNFTYKQRLTTVGYYCTTVLVASADETRLCMRHHSHHHNKADISLSQLMDCSSSPAGLPHGRYKSFSFPYPYHTIPYECPEQHQKRTRLQGRLLHFRVSAYQKTPLRRFHKQGRKMSAQRHPTPVFCGWTGTTLETQ